MDCKDKGPGLVEVLIGKQRLERINNSAMAEKLGVALATWSRIRKGQRQPGVKFLNSVLRTYPDMGQVVREYIATRDDHKATVYPRKKRLTGNPLKG